MKKLCTVLVSTSLLSSAAVVFADNHEEEANVASAVEIFTCTYNEGMGPKDLDAASAKFNKWADKRGIDSYSAWTMTPFYSGPNQDFDVMWLGGSAKAAELGRVQGAYLSSGTDVQAAFDKAMTCSTHSAVSSLAIKAPPSPVAPPNGVVTFSDCNIEGGSTFDDLYMPLIEWGKYK
ncbi:unnamed protein product, partial [Discosporangium mesarthrocarpum]